MTSLGTLPSLTAVALLLAAAACSDNVTQAAVDQQAAASAPAPIASNLGANATLEISTRAWNHEPSAAHWRSGMYRVDVQGADFAPGYYRARTVVVFLDGTVSQLGAAEGMILEDRTFRMSHITNCPSRIREVYEVVLNEGRITESKHITPDC
jgi:hypothetical protein